ncbi:hypothetical protein Mal52_10720 [Symmachiella dynata]|uniref:Uncharacterized protein n=1 Tax=Symmachiella dynata TaxID=2527995 RepID=A0A517ZJD3_9PLAN|nr:hypothetical protein Mal52_10720 [Symmachiella dynata]
MIPTERGLFIRQKSQEDHLERQPFQFDSQKVGRLEQAKPRAQTFDIPTPLPLGADYVRPQPPIVSQRN